jgi:hypothetical protein
VQNEVYSNLPKFPGKQLHKNLHLEILMHLQNQEEHPVMMLGSTQDVANKKVSNILSQVCGVSFISFKQASKPKHREVSNLNSWNFFHRRDIATEKQSLCKIHRNIASCDRSNDL